MNESTQYKTALNYYKSKQYDKSISYFNEILKVNNFHKESWHMLGLIFFETFQYELSISYFEMALQIDNFYPEALYNLGNLYFVLADHQKAVEYLLKVLEFLPNNAELYNKLGVICTQLNLIEESLPYFETSIALNKNNLQAMGNIAKNLMILNRIEEALYYFQKGIKKDKNNAEFHFGIANILLLKGDFSQGWKEYEYRMKLESQKIHYNSLPIPLWKNEKLENQKLLVYYEQGFGDTIQFIRFIKELDLNNLNYTVGIHKSLHKLFTFSFQNVNFLSHEPSEYHYNYALPLMSIPYKYHLNAIKEEKAYLAVNKEDVKIYKQKHVNHENFNIGIVWQGSKTFTSDATRSLQVSYFYDLLNIDNITLYSLQIENFETINEDKIINLGKNFNNFYDTAVAIESLDLIITADTSVAHLAGALGKECWTLIPFAPDWRWGLEGKNTLWYPSMKLYRQITINDWKQPFDEILNALINNRLK